MAVSENTVSAHFYSGFIEEALFSLLSARDIMDHLDGKKEVRAEELVHTNHILSGIHVRHAFLLSATALEAAANGLITAVAAGQNSVFEDLEMSSTLTKFEVFAISRGKRIDRSSDKFEKIKRWIACRNAFVHPKPRRVGITFERDGRDVVLETKKGGNRDYPIAYEFVEFRHSAWFVGDVLSFVAWVVYDICGLSIRDGSQLIGAGVTSCTGDTLLAADEFGFDLRSIGVDPKRHSVVRVPFPRKRPSKRKS